MKIRKMISYCDVECDEMYTTQNELYEQFYELVLVKNGEIIALGREAGRLGGIDYKTPFPRKVLNFEKELEKWKRECPDFYEVIKNFPYKEAE